MKTQKAVLAPFILFLVLATALTLNLYWSYLTPVILSLVLVSIFHPFNSYLLKKFKKPVLAASITSLAAFLCVMVPSILFIISLSGQALNLYSEASNSDVLNGILKSPELTGPYANMVQNFLRDYNLNISVEQLAAWFEKLTQSLGLMIYEAIKSFASNMLYMIGDFLVVLILVFTFFTSGSRLLDYLANLSPIPKKELDILFIKFREISWAVFVGNGIVSIVEGILGGFAFYVLDLGPAIFWGTVIAFAAFLPVVGASVVFIPASVVLYFQHDLSLAVIYLVFNIFYVVVLDMGLKPKLIGNRVSLHPVMVFLAVFSGVQLYGVAGLFYGPLIITMFLALADIYQKRYKPLLF